MTDTPRPTDICEACRTAFATMEGLCARCYWAAIDDELSWDWLDDEAPDGAR